MDAARTSQPALARLLSRARTQAGSVSALHIPPTLHVTHTGGLSDLSLTGR